MRVQVDITPATVRTCSWGDCRTLATTAAPLNFCLPHEKEAALELARVAGEASVERWLDASDSTRYRRFGNALSYQKGGKHAPVIYFMRREREIKIGTSTNLRNRRAALNATVLATMPGGVGEESSLHLRFAALRQKGEWFEPGVELIQYINELRRRHGHPPIAP